MQSYYYFLCLLSNDAKLYEGGEEEEYENIKEWAAVAENDREEKRMTS